MSHHPHPKANEARIMERGAPCAYWKIDTAGVCRAVAESVKCVSASHPARAQIMQPSVFAHTCECCGAGCECWLRIYARGSMPNEIEITVFCALCRNCYAAKTRHGFWYLWARVFLCAINEDERSAVMNTRTLFLFVEILYLLKIFCCLAQRFPSTSSES